MIRARALGLGLLVATTVPALAQSPSVPGGVTMTFGFSQRLEYDDNPPLAPTSPGGSALSTTRLTFSLSSETATQKIVLNTGTALRWSGGSGTQGGIKIDDPQFDLNYTLDVGSSSLSVGANYRRSDIQFLRPLSDFTQPDGTIVLPPDLNDLTGTGFRTDYGVNGALTWGAGGPLGVTLNLGLQGLEYDKVSNPALVDNQRQNAGVLVRMRLNDVTDATANLTFSRYEQDPGLTRAYTRGISLGLTRSLVNGSLGAMIGTSNTNAGTRLNFDVNRVMSLPSGSLTAGLGITRPAGGNYGMTGRLNWQQTLANGSINAQLSRGVTVTNANTEQLQTVVSVQYSQALNPRDGLSLNVTYSLSDPSGTGNNNANTSIGASYSRNLTPDWSMNFGYTHRIRAPEALAGAQSNNVFISLQRNFSIRP